jgi:hypothetical protein
MSKTHHNRLVFCLVSLFTLSPMPVFAQWVIYNFSPRAAYLNSYGLTTNTNETSTTSRTNGWPTNWNNVNAVGFLALYFSTNTNTPNLINALDPLVFNYSNATNTNRLTTNNYVTNLQSILGLTNTNTGSLSNICLFNRTRLGSSASGYYMAAQYTLVSGDTNTNTVGTFLANLRGYTTNSIGTNGVLAGTNYLPQIINLKISALSSLTNPTTATNQQLVLPLSINLALTKTVNTNTSFSGALTNFSILRSNLPGLIRSNNTYTNTP